MQKLSKYIGTRLSGSTLSELTASPSCTAARTLRQRVGNGRGKRSAAAKSLVGQVRLSYDSSCKWSGLSAVGGSIAVCVAAVLKSLA